MKYLIALCAIASLPYSLFAQESSATSTPPSAAPETISVTVNVRHKDLLVYSGAVTLEKGGAASVADQNGSQRSLPSDSALAALAAADALSSEFALSRIAYYPDFDSLYVKCVDIAPIGRDACDNWQYVVDGAYPSVGADDHTLSPGASLYFYFGVPRRVMLSASTVEKTAPVTVTAEAYDYTNDSWRPLSGATIGATQPNPNDPYSPNVLSQAVSDERGVATFSLGPGAYGVGLAADYYAFVESLEVVEPPTPAAPQAAEDRVPRSGGSSARNLAALGAISFEARAETSTSTTEAAATTSPASIVPLPPLTSEGGAMIAIDIPLRDFVARYAAFAALYGSEAPTDGEIARILQALSI